MKNKICPLMSVTCNEFALCQGENCGWYVPGKFSGVEGRCAIQMMGLAAPELVQGVRSV